MNGSQVLAENSGQEGNGSLPSKVTRYSAEERKERIEKYRSKRNQRNFQKKITVIHLSISSHFLVKLDFLVINIGFAFFILAIQTYQYSYSFQNKLLFLF